jgi:hypothetical protein
MKYTIDLASFCVICITSFVKIGLGIQETLRLYNLNELRGCNVGIVGGRDL